MADAIPGMFQIYHGGRLTEGDDKGQNPNDLKFMVPSQGVSSGASQKEQAGLHFRRRKMIPLLSNRPT